MRRRTVIAGITALPLACSGCLGAAPGDSSGGDADGTGDDGTDTDASGNGGTDTDDPGDPTGTETPGGSTVTDGRFTATFHPRRECQSPGEATVDFGGDGPITVAGCVVGKNGCTVARLRDITYDEACTDALVNLGYGATVEVDGALPTAVRVVHDDVDGRRTVVDVTQ
jgi:hypothetical protein